MKNLLICSIIILIFLLILIFSLSSISVKLGLSANQINNGIRDTRYSVVSWSIDKELICECIGLNLRGRQEINSQNAYCYGIRFNCLERCRVYVFKEEIDSVKILNIDCDCDNNCIKELITE